MIPEIKILKHILKIKEPHEWAALIVPNARMFSSKEYVDLLKVHKVFIVSSERRDDCYRAAGINISHLFVLNVPEDVYCVEYMKTRLRGVLCSIHMYRTSNKEVKHELD